MLLAIVGSWIQLALFIGVITILIIRLGSSFDWSSNNNKQANEKSISTIIQSIEKPWDKENQTKDLLFKWKKTFISFVFCTCIKKTQDIEDEEKNAAR